MGQDLWASWRCHSPFPVTRVGMSSHSTWPSTIPSPTATFFSGLACLLYQVLTSWHCNLPHTFPAITAITWSINYHHRLFLIPLKYCEKPSHKCSSSPSWTDAIYKEKLLALYFKPEQYDIPTIQKQALSSDMNGWFIISPLQLPNSVPFYFST